MAVCAGMILDLASRDGSLMLRTEIIQILIKMVLFFILFFIYKIQSDQLRLVQEGEKESRVRWINCNTYTLSVVPL